MARNNRQRIAVTPLNNKRFHPEVVKVLACFAFESGKVFGEMSKHNEECIDYGFVGFEPVWAKAEAGIEIKLNLQRIGYGLHKFKHTLRVFQLHEEQTGLHAVPLTSLYAAVVYDLRALGVLGSPGRVTAEEVAYAHRHLAAY